MEYERVPDVSHWQGAIDFKKMAGQGIKHVILKATQGTNILNSAFHKNRIAAKEAGLGWMPYHYYIPSQDPIAQAAWFVANVPWLEVADSPIDDVEEATGIPTYYASKKLAFLTEVERRTGLRPTIYTRSSYWKLYLSAAVLWADSYRLMVAHYTESAGPLVCAPWDPANWYMWQFTDRFNGPKYGTTSLQVDMSVVNGNVTPRIPEKAASLDELLYISRADTPRVHPTATAGDRLTEWQFRLRFNPRKD